MLLGPHNAFLPSKAEVNKSIDRPILDAVDVDSSLNHLTSIMNSAFESYEDSGMRIFVEVGCSHFQLCKQLNIKYRIPLILFIKLLIILL